MLMATVHLGTKNTGYQMRRYIFKRRADTSQHRRSPQDVGEDAARCPFSHRYPRSVRLGALLRLFRCSGHSIIACARPTHS
jgi:hypothetical protein